MKESAMHQLLCPDGYYTYLNIPKKKVTIPNNGEDDGVDAELVKKNYRRLSLKHHPDRPTGDTETFRVLTRAKRVLTTPALRKEYDLLGMDLEEDDETNDHQEATTTSTDSDDSKMKKTDEHNSNSHDDNNKKSGAPDSVLSTIASATLTTIIQVLIRTAMMASASTLVCRYKILMMLVLPVSSRVFISAVRTGVGWYEKLAPIYISIGMFTMFLSESGEWLFWCGESIVMTCLFLNSMLPTQKDSPGIMMKCLIASTLMAWFLKGKFWRYAIILSIEAGLALIVMIVFPIMEMIFEEIMNEKLRKIGDKIRVKFKRMQELQSQKDKTLPDIV